MYYANPNILFKGKIPDIDKKYNDKLTSIQNQKKLKEFEANAPLRDRLMQAQVQQQEALNSTAQLEHRTNKDIYGANALLSSIESGDIQGAEAILQSQRNGLLQQGQSTQGIDNAIGMLKSNPQALAEMTRKRLQSMQMGVGRQSQVPAGLREHNFHTGVINNPDKYSPDVVKSSRVALGLDARAGSSALERLGADPEATQGVAESQAIIEGSKQDAKNTSNDTSTSGVLKIEDYKLKNQERQLKISTDISNRINSAESGIAEASGALDTIQGLLSSGNYKNAFGKSNHYIPDILKGQDTIDAQAQVDQIVGLISLESREKLKGQGTISDNEAKMLSDSATILANPLISDKMAERELKKVMSVFEGAIKRKNKVAGNPSGGLTPDEQSELEELERLEAEGKL